MIWSVHLYFRFEDCFNTTTDRIIYTAITNMKGQTTIVFVNHNFWLWYSTTYTYQFYHVCRHLVHIFEFGGLKEEWFKLCYVIQQIIIDVNTICFSFYNLMIMIKFYYIYTITSFLILTTFEQTVKIYTICCIYFMAVAILEYFVQHNFTPTRLGLWWQTLWRFISFAIPSKCHGGKESCLWNTMTGLESPRIHTLEFIKKHTLWMPLDLLNINSSIWH